MEDKKISLKSLRKFWGKSRFQSLGNSEAIRNLLHTETYSGLFRAYADLMVEHLENLSSIFSITKPMSSILNMGGHAIENIKWSPSQQAPVSNGVLRDFCLATKQTSDDVTLCVSGQEVALSKKIEKMVYVDVTKSINSIHLNISSTLDLDAWAGEIFTLHVDNIRLEKNLRIPEEFVYGLAHMMDTATGDTWVCSATMFYADNKLKLKINTKNVNTDQTTLFLKSAQFVTTSTSLF